MCPPENLNNIHVYNLIIPLKSEKDCNFPVTVSYKSTSVPYAEPHSEQKILVVKKHFNNLFMAVNYVSFP